MLHLEYTFFLLTNNNGDGIFTHAFFWFLFVVGFIIKNNIGSLKLVSFDLLALQNVLHILQFCHQLDISFC